MKYGLVILLLSILLPMQAFAVREGGGGFFKKSPKLLARAQDAVISYLNSVSEEALDELMPDIWKSSRWNKQRLISIIKNACPEEGEFRKRYSRPLLFDRCDGDSTSPSCQNTDCQGYATDGQYISALFPFYSSYENIATDKDSQISALRETETALIHEAVHLLGVGTAKDNDFDAEALATKILLLGPGNAATMDSICNEFPVECNKVSNNGGFVKLTTKSPWDILLMARSSNLTLTMHTTEKTANGCAQIGGTFSSDLTEVLPRVRPQDPSHLETLFGFYGFYSVGLGDFIPFKDESSALLPLTQLSKKDSLWIQLQVGGATGFQNYGRRGYGPQTCLVSFDLTNDRGASIRAADLSQAAEGLPIFLYTTDSLVVPGVLK